MRIRSNEGDKCVVNGVSPRPKWRSIRLVLCGLDV